MLKYSPEVLNAWTLILKAAALFFDRGVESEVVRVTDYMVRFGTYAEGDPERRQYPLYGKVAGEIVTNNEDGAYTVSLIFDVKQEVLDAPLVRVEGRLWMTL
jgi:hypothetical protein